VGEFIMTPPVIQSVTLGDRTATIILTPVTNPDSTTYKAIGRTNNVDAVMSAEFTSQNASITISELIPGQTYTFRVEATKGASKAVSNSSAALVAITTPGVPTSITARRRSNGRATITFISGENGFDSSVIYTVTSTPGNNTASGPGTSILVEGLTNGTSYTFKVVASNRAGTSNESAISNSIILTDTLDRLISFNIIKDVNHFENKITTTSIDEKSVANLTDMSVDITLARSENTKLARQYLIKHIFEEKSDITAFKVNRVELSLTSTNATNTTVLVVKPATITSEPLNISNILSENTSIYADLPEIGSVNRFAINSDTITITKVSANQFTFVNGSGAISTHSTGEVILYNRLVIEFGSALIYNYIENSQSQSLTDINCGSNAPYNATNFTPANSIEFNTLVGYAKTQPQYPWASGSNAQQIYRSKQDITYFNQMNQAVAAVKNTNSNVPYPRFKTQTERLMYIQGMTLTAARNKMTGMNPSAPAGVPCSTIYQIINS
jgi:hypothetical protein